MEAICVLRGEQVKGTLKFKVSLVTFYLFVTMQTQTVLNAVNVSFDLLYWVLYRLWWK